MSKMAEKWIAVIVMFFIYSEVWCGQWGHDLSPGNRQDPKRNILLLPDPDLPASADGYIYQIRVHSTQALVDFRIKILRRIEDKIAEYLVVASSGTNGEELWTTKTQDSDTIKIVPPLPVRSGDLVAFYFTSMIPIAYSEDTCYPGSHYMFLDGVDPTIKQLVELHEGVGQDACRTYSYILDYVSGAGECVSVYQGTSDSSNIIATPHYGSYFYEDNLDLCWHITSDTGTTIIASLDYELQDCCDFVEIFDGSTPQSPLLGKVTGRKTSQEFKSTERNMYIRVTTDGSESRYNGMIAHIYTRGGKRTSSGSMLDTNTKIGLGIGFALLILLIIGLITAFCVKYVLKKPRRHEHVRTNTEDIKEPRVNLNLHNARQQPPVTKLQSKSNNTPPIVFSSVLNQDSRTGNKLPITSLA